MLEWIVKHSRILPALDLLSNIPARTGIAASQILKLDPGANGVLRVFASSEISGVVRMHGEGTFPLSKSVYLDRDLFLPFVFVGKDLAKKPYRFSFRDGRLVVKQGLRVGAFDLMPSASGYSVMPPLEEVQPLSFEDAPKKMIEFARAVTRDSSVSKPALACVYLRKYAEGLELLSSDHYIICLALSKSKERLKQPIPFPLFLITLLDREGLKKIYWSQKQTVLEFEQGAIWQAVSESSLTKFPAKELSKQIDRCRFTENLFDVTMDSLADTVAHLQTCLASFTRHEWVLSVTGNKGDDKVTFSSGVSHGAFRESMKLTKPLKTSFEIRWVFDRLTEILVSLQQKQKEAGSVITVRHDAKQQISYLETLNVVLIIPDVISSKKKRKK